MYPSAALALQEGKKEKEHTIDLLFFKCHLDLKGRAAQILAISFGVMGVETVRIPLFYSSVFTEKRSPSFSTGKITNRRTMHWDHLEGRDLPTEK